MSNLLKGRIIDFLKIQSEPITKEEIVARLYSSSYSDKEHRAVARTMVGAYLQGLINENQVKVISEAGYARKYFLTSNEDTKPKSDREGLQIVLWGQAMDIIKRHKYLYAPDLMEELMKSFTLTTNK